MRTLGLRVDIECEVDNLGNKLTEKDALWLAVMRALERITRGDVTIVDDLSVGCCTPLVDGDVVGALSLKLLTS